MTDTTASVDAAPAESDPGPPPPRPAGSPRPDGRFFAWVRGIGVSRSHGWLGGVCAGIAARLGVDPILIRGVFVVAALVGFPAVLVYAMAWALLPDTDGRIILQRLGRGYVDGAFVAIVIMAVLAFAPVTRWTWEPIAEAVPMGYFLSRLAALLTLSFTTLFWVGAVVLVLWLIFRTRRTRVEAHPRQASADVASPNPSAGGRDAAATPFGSVEAAASELSPEQDFVVAEPHSPGAAVAVVPVAAGSAVGEAEWRAQQEQWRTQHDAWRVQQQDAERAARAIARQEREEQGRSFALEADAQRAERRRMNPRASAGAVFAVLGAGLVVGASVALAFFPQGMIVALCAGFLTAALVGGIGMVVCGALRRRSGFLAFVTTATLVVGLGMLPFTTSGQLLLSSYGIGGFDVQPRSYVQPFGGSNISLESIGSDATAGTIALRKGAGQTDIQVAPGVHVILNAHVASAPITYSRIDVETGELIASGQIPPALTGAKGNTYRWEYENPSSAGLGMTTQTVKLDQGSGPVTITIYEDAKATQTEGKK